MNALPIIYLLIVLFFLAQAFHHAYTKRPRWAVTFLAVAMAVWAGLLA